MLRALRRFDLPLSLLVLSLALGALCPSARAQAGTGTSAPTADLSRWQSSPVRPMASVGFTLRRPYVGPGTFTVGNWGSRKQLLLPIGTWIPVAAQEHDLVGVTTLPLASVALVKLDGATVTEMLWVTFSRQEPPPVPTVGVNSTPQWPMATACENGDPNGWHRLKDSDMRTRWCAQVRPLEPTSEYFAATDALRAEVSAALSAISVRPGAFRVQSEYHVSNRQGSFISYVHLQEKLLSPILLDADLSASDVSVPREATAELRQIILQLAHYAYHAAMAFQRQYPDLVLREATAANPSTVQRDLGRLP